MATVVIKTEPEDYENSSYVCRLCLSNESLEDVFKEDDLELWISDFLSITIKADDRMSHFICTICRLRLTEFHQFKAHCHEVQAVLKSMAVQNENIDCSVCFKTFATRKQLNGHKRVHAPKKYPCNFCDASYPIPSLLIRHQKCDKKCRKIQELIARLSEEGTDAQSKSVLVSETLRENEQDLQAECFIEAEKSEGISDVFVIEDIKLETSLVEHAGTPTIETHAACDGIENVSSQNNSADPGPSQQRIVIENLSPTQCQICNKTYGTKEKLLQHSKTVHGPKKYSCDICSFRTAFRNAFNRHMQTMQHRCMAQVRHDINHSTDVNTEPLAQVGSEDGRSIETNGNEIKSENVDTGHRSAQNVRRRSLKSFWEKVKYHESTNYTCLTCGQSFITRRSIAQHMKKHDRDFKFRIAQSRQVKCELCQKTFKHKDSLRHHSRYSHGPKSYSCNVCDYRSSLRRSFERHVKTHC